MGFFRSNKLLEICSSIHVCGRNVDSLSRRVYTDKCNWCVVVVEGLLFHCAAVISTPRYSGAVWTEDWPLLAVCVGSSWRSAIDREASPSSPASSPALASGIDPFSCCNAEPAGGAGYHSTDSTAVYAILRDGPLISIDWSVDVRLWNDKYENLYWHSDIAVTKSQQNVLAIFRLQLSRNVSFRLLCRVYTRTHVARKHVSRTSNLYPDTYMATDMSPDTSCSFRILADCISAARRHNYYSFMSRSTCIPLYAATDRRQTGDN